MRKLLLFILLFTVSKGMAQTYSVNIKGRWGNWESSYQVKLNGSPFNAVIYNSSNHPSDYCFKWDIHPETFIPSLKEWRNADKRNEFIRIPGYVEYFVPNTNMKFKDVIHKFPNGYSMYYESAGYIKKRVPCEIYIQPDKGYRLTINIMFEDVAIGVGDTTLKYRPKNYPYKVAP